MNISKRYLHNCIINCVTIKQIFVKKFYFKRKFQEVRTSANFTSFYMKIVYYPLKKIPFTYAVTSERANSDLSDIPFSEPAKSF